MRYIVRLRETKFGSIEIEADTIPEAIIAALKSSEIEWMDPEDSRVWSVEEC
jgi:hypothetical protein